MLACASAGAETRRAVLVVASQDPIAASDADGLRDVLTARFGVDVGRCVIVRPGAQAATLMRDLQRRLVEDAAPGDASLLYISARGRGLGAADVGFAGLYRAAAERRVKLTVIVDADSDIAVQAQSRDAVETPLVIAAGRDRGVPSHDLGRAYSAFTSALLRAMGAADVDTPVDALFQQLETTLASTGSNPVLGGPGERRARGMFGQAARADGAPARMSVISIDRGAGLVLLNGGRAMGLAPACVLKRVTPENGPSLRLEVASVIGVSRAEASVAEGGGINNAGGGDLFELERCPEPR